MYKNEKRMMAWVTTVSEVLEHTNADALEICKIGGWQVVTRKGEFKAGDKVVYFEIDSWIPNHIAPFLSKGKEPRVYNGVAGERLRTVKLRGALSQGLILPVSILGNESYSDGDDLTEILNIQKWEAPIPTELAGTVEGLFPSFIRKTDEERIQSCFKDMKQLDYDGEWEVTEKAEGSSCTIYVNFHKDVADGYYSVGVCSRNFELKLNENDTNAFMIAAKNEGWLEHLPKLGLSIAIQAELCGPGIQGNLYKLNEPKLFVYNIWSIQDQKYATRSQRMDILTDLAVLGVKLNTVPTVAILNDLPDTLDEILTMADGKSKINPEVLREGLVFKTMSLCDNKVVSFKAISNEYLLKQK